MYDSKNDTEQHIEKVNFYLFKFIFNMVKEGLEHDRSKLFPPEKEIFDEFTPKLKELTYGGDEYKKCLQKMNVALEHHYKNNSHHPEFFENGISDMNMLHLIVMLADWKAAATRHSDGDILKSLEINRKRFKMSDQLYNLLKNTLPLFD